MVALVTSGLLPALARADVKAMAVVTAPVATAPKPQTAAALAVQRTDCRSWRNWPLTLEIRAIPISAPVCSLPIERGSIVGRAARVINPRFNQHINCLRFSRSVVGFD